MGFAVIVGILVGSTGIGGLFLPVALVSFAGMTTHSAIATSVWVFLFTGFSGAGSYARRQSIAWASVRWLIIGSAVGSVVGALTSTAVPGNVLALALSASVILGGAAVIVSSRPRHTAVSLKPWMLVSLGLAVGCLSALTGTGGPVVLVPILLLLGTPTLLAIGAGQVIQLPIALFASATYLVEGKTDLVLGTALAIAAVAGVLLGVRLAHALPIALLRRFLAGALIVTGILVAIVNA